MVQLAGGNLLGMVVPHLMIYSVLLALGMYCMEVYICRNYRQIGQAQNNYAIYLAGSVAGS